MGTNKNIKPPIGRKVGLGVLVDLFFFGTDLLTLKFIKSFTRSILVFIDCKLCCVFKKLSKGFIISSRSMLQLMIIPNVKLLFVMNFGKVASGGRFAI